MKEQIEPSNDRMVVDNYIITALITLISAFIIILTIKKPTNDLVSYFSVLSLFCLIFSFLLCLWHRLRFPYRQRLYAIEKDKKIHEISQEIADFEIKYVRPKKKLNAIELYSKNPELDNKKIQELSYSEKDEEDTKNIIIVYLKKFNFEMKEINEKIFSKPLDENHRKTKYFIDSFAKTSRYPLFVIGLISFFLSIILNLL